MRLASVKSAIDVLRHVGAGNVLHWAWHRALLRCGHYRRRLPARPWGQIVLGGIVREGVPAGAAGYAAYRREHGGRFFFPGGQLPPADALAGQWDQAARQRTVAVADDYCRGRFLYFSHSVGDLGNPVDWHLNPFNGARVEPRVHWSQGGNFNPAAGDVKFFWEPSRFALSFWLVRAFWLTGDAKYPERFWELVELWAAANPPQLGVNWQSGQETALRAMAMCFGLYAFADCPATTPARAELLARVLSEHGQRIEAFIGHAIRQKTNHSLVEAAGLMTLGLLFPEFRRADRWLAVGRRVIQAELARQVYADGSYVQQSTNYHRVMLQACCWAKRLAEVNGQPLGEQFRELLARAGEFAFQLIDSASGRTPNYGGNDGALVLPLDSCDYLDYRPAVQLAAAVTGGKMPFGPGPWNEPLLWLCGAESVTAGREGPRQPATSNFHAGGYYTLRGGAGGDWCMVRCHRYRDRVTHVDPLHVDLWHAGENILRDGGSYLYFVPGDPALERYFLSIQAHNTVQIDRQEPLRLLSRFLWSPWPRAKRLAPAGPAGDGALAWEGEHYAYARRPWNCVHRRRVEFRPRSGWRISDNILGRGRRVIQLRWRLPDRPYELDAAAGRLTVQLADGPMQLSIWCDRPLEVEVVRGRASPNPAGWESLYYGVRQPSPVVVATVAADLPVSMVTELRV